MLAIFGHIQPGIKCSEFVDGILLSGPDRMNPQFPRLAHRASQRLLISLSLWDFRGSTHRRHRIMFVTPRGKCQPECERVLIILAVTNLTQCTQQSTFESLHLDDDLRWTNLHNWIAGKARKSPKVARTMRQDGRQGLTLTASGKKT